MLWIANAVFVALKLSGVGMLIAIATVVIAEAKNIMNNNAAFRFNFSPPFLFFHPRIIYIGVERKKAIWS